MSLKTGEKQLEVQSTRGIGANSHRNTE